MEPSQSVIIPALAVDTIQTGYGLVTVHNYYGLAGAHLSQIGAEVLLEFGDRDLSMKPSWPSPVGYIIMPVNRAQAGSRET